MLFHCCKFIMLDLLEALKINSSTKALFSVPRKMDRKFPGKLLSTQADALIFKRDVNRR